MNRTIIPHSDDFVYSSDDTIFWNKHTIKSECFTSFLQKKDLQREERLRKKLLIRPCNTSDLSYEFVTLQDLFHFQQYRDWSNNHLQTVGFMKFEKDGYKLYPLSRKDDDCVKIKFNNFINSTACPEIYARIYGFCMFYANEQKVIPIHPEDLRGHKPYLEIRVNNWLDLGSLQHALHVEQILFKINYSKNAAR